MSVDPAPLTEAIRRFRAGDIADAERRCREVLDAEPHSSPALHLLALIAAQTGHEREALDLLDRAVAIDAFDPSLHNSRGSLLFQAGRVKDAEAAFRRSIAVNDRLPESHGNLGNVLRAQGRLDDAEVAFRAALSIRPSAPELLAYLATTLRDLGRFAEAEAALRQALQLAPEFVEARFHLADLLALGGRYEAAEAEFRRLIADAPSLIQARVGLAHALHSLDRAGEAVDAIEEARRLAPDHPLVTRVRRLIHSNAVPAWHLPMINDRERNQAYDEALRRAVRPGDRVLEIGTGSGLVAMMAARAGAGHVVTCEVNPILARVAEETVARNGLSDRIAVIPKLSTQLVPGVDLPEKADVFVSELINVGMLAPRMLAVLQHARAHLVKPGARIIPAGATVYAVLVEAPELAAINPVEEIEGFDLSAFDVFRSPGYQQIDLAADSHEFLSEPFVALEFDFTRAMPEDGRRVIDVAVTRRGTAHGVAFWFDLDMGEGVVYHSGSRSRSNHWKQAMAWFGAPIKVTEGSTITILAHHDANQIGFGVTEL